MMVILIVAKNDVTIEMVITLSSHTANKWIQFVVLSPFFYFSHNLWKEVFLGIEMTITICYIIAEKRRIDFKHL